MRSLFTGWFWECFGPELWRLWRKPWWSTGKSVSKYEEKGGEDGQWQCGRAGGGRDEGVEVLFGRNEDRQDQEWVGQRVSTCVTLGGEIRLRFYAWFTPNGLFLCHFLSNVEIKDSPWADLLCCDWCEKSFTPIQVCSLRPDMNVCPLAFKWRRAGAVFQRELGCVVDLWHGFWNSLWERMKTRYPSYLHGEDLQTDDWPSWISPPTASSSVFMKQSTGPPGRWLGLCFIFCLISFHGKETVSTAENVSAVDEFRPQQVKYPPPSNIHIYLCFEITSTEIWAGSTPPKEPDDSRALGGSIVPNACWLEKLLWDLFQYWFDFNGHWTRRCEVSHLSL